jgi:hypothetical protein
VVKLKRRNGRKEKFEINLTTWLVAFLISFEEKPNLQISGIIRQSNL